MDINILWLVVIVPAAAFLGVMLGRRSKTANTYADTIQAKLDAAREEVRQLRAKNRND